MTSGAIAMTGGAPVEGPGYFYQPTVPKHLAATAGILEEEIFGPVAPTVTFTEENEAIELANNTEYGLAAYVFTKDLNRGLRASERIESGMLGLNAGVISNAAAHSVGSSSQGSGVKEE